MPTVLLLLLLQVICSEAGVWFPALLSFCHSFLSLAVLLSATYFPFIRSLSRHILFLPLAAVLLLRKSSCRQIQIIITILPLCHAWFLQSACHIVLLLVVGRSMDATTCRKSNISGSVSPACLLPVVCRGKDPVYVKPAGIPLPGVTETRRAHSYCNCRAAKVRQNYAYVEVRCHIFCFCFYCDINCSMMVIN